MRTKTLSVSEARDRLGQLLDDVRHHDDLAYIITTHRRNAAVLVNHDTWQTLQHLTRDDLLPDPDPDAVHYAPQTSVVSLCASVLNPAIREEIYAAGALLDGGLIDDPARMNEVTCRGCIAIWVVDTLHQDKP